METGLEGAWVVGVYRADLRSALKTIRALGLRGFVGFYKV